MVKLTSQSFIEQPKNVEGFVANLRAVDWDFANAKTNYLTHSIHPYPAKYIPQIPKTLIQKFSSPGETVADIFCGSGTTLVEALLLGRNAIGVDANPLACLISEAKITRLVKNDEDSLRDVVSHANALVESIGGDDTPLFCSKPFVSSAPRPSNDAISFWFEPFVTEELAEALSLCRGLSTRSSQLVALTAFSSVVVSVSKQDSDTRYVRRDKKIRPGDTMRRFARSLSDATQAVCDFTKLVSADTRARILHADLLTEPELGPTDLVVCSPPYPNAYSYHLYHMTRMLWLGMDQPKFKREEIGSHRKYSNRGPKGATAETFSREMSVIFRWLRRHLRRDRYACFVVGNSTLRGQVVNNADLISDVAVHQGFREVDRLVRRIQDTKKAFNPVIGKIKQEQILVLQNVTGKVA